MRARTSSLPVTLLMIALSGCRPGLYAGTIRGQGSSGGGTTGVAATKTPASISAGDWELTGDVPLGKFVIMSMVGGGGVRVRQQTMENTGRTTHLGAGVGYEALRLGRLRLTAFGAAVLEPVEANTLSLGSVYLAGLQADLMYFETAAVSIRLAYALPEAAVPATGETFNGNAVLLQVGTWLGLGK